MAEGYKSRHTGAAIDNVVDRVKKVPTAENNKYLHINASGEPEWSSIVVDDAMSSSSENPVQNKVVTTALNEKLSKTEFEEFSDGLELNSEHISGGSNLGSITINGDVWNIPEVVVDDALSDVSENPVQNKVVYAALQNTPSTSDVQSMIDTAIQGAINKSY